MEPKQQDNNKTVTTPADTFCQRAKQRAIICAVVLLVCWILKYLLRDLWDNPIIILAMIPILLLGIVLLGCGLYLLIQPAKAACRWIRGVDGGRAFTWTLAPWLALCLILTADNLCYKGYLAWRRPVVLRQIQTGILKGADGAVTGVMKMQLIDHWTSSDGTVYVFQNTPDKLIVGFWLRHGMLSASSYHIYTSGDSQPSWAELGEVQDNILFSKKLSPHWYEMTIDY